MIGGRLGYVLFYRPGYYLSNPLEALAVWHGGMSFHGGVSAWSRPLLFAHLRGRSTLEIGDAVCAAAPIGLFFGRIANFINGELFGRVSDVPWAIVFHTAARAAAPEPAVRGRTGGLVLFGIMTWFAWRPREPDSDGRLAGIFLIGYGVARIFVELFREPDPHLGFLIGGLTMGQLLSLPLIVIGAAGGAQLRPGARGPEPA